MEKNTISELFAMRKLRRNWEDVERIDFTILSKVKERMDTNPELREMLDAPLELRTATTMNTPKPKEYLVDE